MNFRRNTYDKLFEYKKMAEVAIFSIFASLISLPNYYGRGKERTNRGEKRLAQGEVLVQEAEPDIPFPDVEQRDDGAYRRF